MPEKEKRGLHKHAMVGLISLINYEMTKLNLF